MAAPCPYMERFLAYARGFLDRGGDDMPHRLKLDHTLRVVDNAVAIAEAEGLDPDLRRLARLAALGHDYGRFEQYEAYRTFADSESINHGLLGARLLHAHGFFADLPRDERRTVLKAVVLHNRLALPEGLAGAEDVVARVVRDADKLDIFGVMLSLFESDAPPHPVLALGCTREPTRWTPQALDAVLRRENGSYGALRFENDLKLLLASWVYDMDHAAALRLLVERGLLARLLASLPEHPDMAPLRRSLNAELGRRLPRRGHGRPSCKKAPGVLRG